MEVNKDEALRCLTIAQRHRGSSNLTAALKFARKSVSLYRTPEGEAMVVVIEREISVGGEASAAGGAGGSSSSPPATPSTPNGSSSARATGVEEHVTSAHRRHPEKKDDASSSKPAPAADSKGKKREYTVKQLEVVTRIKKCREYEYYEILAGAWSCCCARAGTQHSDTQLSRENMYRERRQTRVQEARARTASRQERRSRSGRGIQECVLRWGGERRCRSALTPP